MRDEPDLHATFSDADSITTLLDAPQASDYLDELKGDDYDDLTLAEKVELLECIFAIMKSFSDMGHGLDPVNKLIEQFEISSDAPLLVLDCEDATDEE